MIDDGRKDGQSDRVAAISAALLARFGDRAQDVAQRQTELAVDGAAQTWTEIFAHIAMHSLPDGEQR